MCNNESLTHTIYDQMINQILEPFFQVQGFLNFMQPMTLNLRLLFFK